MQEGPKTCMSDVAVSVDLARAEWLARDLMGGDYDETATVMLALVEELRAGRVDSTNE